MDQDANATTTKPENPLLCPDCQAWDDAGLLTGRFYPGKSVVVQGAPDNVQCIVCKAAMKAVAARISHMGLPQTSRVFFDNRGPFCLGSSRYDTSDSTESVVRVVMSLQVRVETRGLRKLLQSRFWRRSFFVFFAPTSEEDIEQKEFEMTPQFCLRFQPSGGHKFLKSAEQWEVPFFNISLLKQWIRDCTDCHGAACRGNIQAQTVALPQGFRVINLSTMNVEEPMSALSYVALSYMWPSEKDSERVQLERSNLHRLEQPDGLNQVVLPPIIADAMLLCKQLGENYLWVDRLCIIQDDPNSKHSQIQGMDKIYRSANLTIMAALNDRDMRGLPGLVNLPRVSSVYRPKYELEIEGRIVKSGGLSAADMSAWNTRGWTFQERVLSTRRLYITEHQVLFECPRGYESEVDYGFSPRPTADLDLAASEERGPKGPEDELEKLPGSMKWSDRYKTVNYHITHDTSVQDYLDWVTNYTSRQLSIGSDILNAFAGISGILGEMIGSDYIFGLPEKFLVQGLMWSASDAIELRKTVPEIPSWSWASCPNNVNYGRIADSKDDCIHVISLVYFHFQDPKEGLRRVKAPEWWVEREMPTEDFRSRDDVPPIETITTKYLPCHERTSLTWREWCPHNPWQTLLHTTLEPEACRIASTLPGALVFNTTMATLRLEPNCYTTEEGNEEEHLEIRPSMNGLSHEGWECDSIGTIDGPFPRGLNAKKLAKKKQEIIVICGALAGFKTRKVYIKWGVGPGFNMWRLHVMLIERDEANPFIARRVGVGYVQAHMWMDFSPKWDTVVLC